MMLLYGYKIIKDKNTIFTELFHSKNERDDMSSSLKRCIDCQKTDNSLFDFFKNNERYGIILKKLVSNDFAIEDFTKQMKFLCKMFVGILILR